MTRPNQLSARPVLATLGMQWLVLIVITLGMLVSSIGLTSSHGLAAMAESHEPVQHVSASSHGHAHAGEAVEVAAVPEGSVGDHPHHGMDHSHDTAHYPPDTWGSAGSLLPDWQPMMRPRIEPGQAVRLDRPPMG